MNMNDAIGALATAIAADVKALEDGVVSLAGKMDDRMTAALHSLQALTDEVRSIIDDQSQESNANTWSIDQIKAYVDQRLADHVAATAAAAVPSAETQADFVATYHNAKGTPAA